MTLPDINEHGSNDSTGMSKTLMSCSYQPAINEQCINEPPGINEQRFNDPPSINEQGINHRPGINEYCINDPPGINN